MVGLLKRNREVGAELAEQRERFERDGYLILGGFVGPELCDRVVSEANLYYESQGATADRADRTMNLHHVSPAAREILLQPETTEVVSAMLDGDAVFFQSIYFNTGSQQSPHSDHMFMSTEPDDQLLGFWLACEDVEEGAGELLYYPGSHKLPLTRIHEYYEANADRLESEIESQGDELRERYRTQMDGAGQSLMTAHFYEQWEREHRRLLDEGGFEPRTFLPRKGDVLLWHAKLAHGGSEVTRPDSTRRSLVAHYMSNAMRRLYEMNWVDSRRPLSLRKVKRRVKSNEAPDLYLKG